MTQTQQCAACRKRTSRTKWQELTWYWVYGCWVHGYVDASLPRAERVWELANEHGGVTKSSLRDSNYCS